MPQISVIVPVYNKEKYLEKLLRQIMQQTFLDFECILIDDGSKDRSSVICDDIRGKDSRFRVFHIPNGGVSHARNFGIEEARGEYITFIDADDEIDKDFLKNLYQCIMDSRADLVISGFEKFWDTKKERQAYCLPYTKGTHSIKELLPNFCKIQDQSGIYGCCTAKIFSKARLGTIRFDESLKLAEDFDFYLHILEKCNTVYVDDAALYFYRQAAENSSVQSDYENDYLSQVKIYLHYQNFLQAKNAFYGENQRIIQQKIGDYMYFTLFYSNSDNLQFRIQKLRDMIFKNHIDYTSGSTQQKILLSLLKKNCVIGIKSYLMLYRGCRTLLKGRR